MVVGGSNQRQPPMRSSSSCLEVGVLEPLDPQDGASARHLRSFKELLRQT